MTTFDLLFDQQYHGRNIAISGEGKIAQREVKRGGKDALAVTNRPLWNNELFEVEIGNCTNGQPRTKGSLKKKGSLTDLRFKPKEYIRVGITTHTPDDLFTSQPPSMKRMNSGTWLMKGEEVIENGESLITYAKYNLKDLAIADRVGLMRVPEFNGSLVIFINGEAIGIVAKGIPEKMYGFVELQNDCDRVCITRCHAVKLEVLPDEIRAVRERDAEIRSLKKQLVGKDELVQVLEGQMETLRKQLMSSKSSRTRSPVMQQEKETRETQTRPDMPDSPGKIVSPIPKQKKKKKEKKEKKSNCVIS